MFNPQKEKTPGWESDIRDDVILELSDHGGKNHFKKSLKTPRKHMITLETLKNPFKTLKTL